MTVASVFAIQPAPRPRTLDTMDSRDQDEGNGDMSLVGTFVESVTIPMSQEWFRGKSIQPTDSGFPATAQELHHKYESIFSKLTVSDTVTPDDVLRERIRGIFQIINVSRSGVISGEESEAVDVSDAEPLLRSMFTPDNSPESSERQRLLVSGKKPIVGMSEDAFLSHVWRLREASNEPLFEFLLKYLEKQIPGSVGKFYATQRSKIDPSSEEFDIRAHLKNRSRVFAGSLGVSVCMQGLGFKTVKHELAKESVFSTIKSLLCGCFVDFAALLANETTPTHMIFEDLDAVSRPGEMTLIIGPPGSGKSTLLKCVSAQYRKHASRAGVMVGGLRYNGHEQATNVDNLVNLILPHDEHLPLQTVGDTFQFIHDNTSPTNPESLAILAKKLAYKAAGRNSGFDETKMHALNEALQNKPPAEWPGVELTEEELASFNRDVEQELPFREKDLEANMSQLVEVVLRVLRLTHVKDTCVGNTFIRGVSGGERRRVSIGEAILKKVPIMCCDEITNGLDANSALAVLHAMKMSCQSMATTNISSLLQPSPDIYSCFDRIIMLHAGRVVYSGKREQICDDDFELFHIDTVVTTTKGDVQDRALAYFDSIGLAKPFYLPTPDFLDQVTGGPDQTACFNQEWNRQHGEDWAQTEFGSQNPPPISPDDFASRWKASRFCTENKAEVETEMAKEKGDFDMARIEAFQVPFMANLKSVIARQWKYTLTDVGAMKQAIAQSVFIAFLAGTLFLSLPETYSGGVSRAGLIFFICTNTTFGSFAVLPTIFQQRSVFYKQKRQNVINTSAYVVACVVAAVPVDTVRSVVFASILYWLVGFQALADKYLFFVLVVWLMSFTMGQFCRTIGSLAPSQSVAQSVAPISGIIMMAFSGYLLSKENLPVYLVWAYSVSPLRYAFEALMINELKGLTYSCASVMVCPNFQDGNSELEYYGYSTDENQKWLDAGIMVIFWAFFFTMNSVCYQHLRYDIGRGAGAKEIEQESPTEEKQKPKVLRDQNMKVALSFNDLTYDVLIPAEDGTTRQLRLLQQCYGYFVPGTATCLMGSSGAGKTTLMDVIAGMKTGGTIGGDIWVNHEDLLVEDTHGNLAPSPSFRRYVGYVEQSDIHMDTQTIREAFAFSAATRLPRATQIGEQVTDADRAQMVEYTINMLELSSCADLQIKQLDSQQLKRCTMGVELVADPAILFLDEPTSGLDSIGALTVMKSIKKVVAAGVTVICTIHQPSETLFNYFDNLLLLKKGGYQVYFGPCPKRQIGEDTVYSLAFKYFQNLKGANKWQGNNPADYILDFCDANKDFHLQYAGSSIGTKLRTWIVGNLGSSARGSTDVQPAHQYFAKHSLPEFDTEYAVPAYCDQLSIVFKRARSDFWYSPDYNATRMLTAIGTSTFLGLMYLRPASDTLVGCQSRVSVLFAGIMVQITGMLQAMNPLFRQRAILFREHQSKCYKKLAYVAATFAVEVPYILCATNLFAWILFFLVDLNTAADRVLYYILFFVIYNTYIVAFGQFVAAMVPTQALGSALGPATSTLFVLVAGFMIVPSEIPSYWKWLYWISPNHYALEGFVSNELEGRQCGTASGNDILASLDMDPDNKWRDLVVIAFYLVLLRIGVIFAFNIEHIKR